MSDSGGAVHAKGSSNSPPRQGNGPGSRLCPLPKRLAKRKKDGDGMASAAGQQGVISVRSTSPASGVASPGHVDPTTVSCPDQIGAQGGRTQQPALLNGGPAKPGNQSAPTLDLPLQLPGGVPGSADTAGGSKQAKTVSPGSAKFLLDSFRQKKRTSFGDRFNDVGEISGRESAAGELIKAWYVDRVKELADGQRCELQQLLLAEGAEHVNDNIDTILASFKSRVVSDTSVIDRLSSRIKSTFNTRAPETARSLDRRFHPSTSPPT